MKNFLQRLNDEGLIIIDPFIGDTLIKDTFREVSEAFNTEYINVSSDDIFIKTLNGDKLLALCPNVGKVYKYVLDLLKSEFSEIHELTDKTIGISANFLSGQNDRFRLHFDRNQLTVVVYLNDLNVFPLVLYPNVRRDPLFVGVKDSFDLAAINPKSILPKQNLAVVFYGRRTFHGVTNENPVEIAKQNPLRYSLQFAFDFDSFDYGEEDYYGKKL